LVDFFLSVLAYFVSLEDIVWYDKESGGFIPLP